MDKTAEDTMTTIHPAVINGRPNIRCPDAETVFALEERDLVSFVEYGFRSKGDADVGCDAVVIDIERSLNRVTSLLFGFKPV